MKNASLASGRLQVGECTAPSTDGEVNGTWHTQWVGPFTTHGGYDWTTVSWVDPAFIMRGRRRGESVGLAAHWMGPVDVQRTQALGLPPLHLHHVHMTASPDDTFLSPFLQWHHGRVIMTHGDWNFDGMPGEENGTVDAMGQDYRPAKVLKMLSDRPSINVEVNDVRPAGSPPLQWYFQVTVLVVDNLDDARAAGHRPLSSIKTQAPDGEGMLVGGQTGLVFPYFAPRTEDTMMYHSIRMPEDGEMVHVYFHAHQRTHQATLLFGGPPSALGLDAIAAAGRHVSVLPTQVYTNTTGVAKNNVQMRSLLEERSHVRGVPLVCTMEGRVQRLSGYGFTTPKPWDRAAYPSCIRWSFSKGEVFTSVAFNGPIDFDVPESNVFWDGVGQRLPRTMAQHSIYVFFYLPTDQPPSEDTPASRYYFFSDCDGPGNPQVQCLPYQVHTSHVKALVHWPKGSLLLVSGSILIGLVVLRFRRGAAKIQLI
ncbi:hypothetical protein AB1Y20_021154 [Prymnesium parvum]|uniref:Uncharacterized protein n=1 Tax=Prymnesium parvum TaxID=97485 RepID=A0AB34JKS3_PRYPA